MFALYKTYNFNTLVPSILGESYKNVTVKEMMTAEAAVKYRDIHTLHTKVKAVEPTLPDNVYGMTYILFETLDKVQVVLPLEYIDVNSIEVVTKINLSISVYDIDNTDINIIRNRLLELGYSNIKIETFQ